MRPGSKPAPGLYLVATPIGNLEDVTFRAARILAGADLIAAEDTRVSAVLMRALGVATPLISYNEHNADRVGPQILERLRQGQRVALVSDAGTPLVSDPGQRLVETCLAEGLAVTALPGPSAVLTALQLSGLPAQPFLFAGFPPAKAVARRRAFDELAGVPASLVFFESPNRLAASLTDMAAVLGARPAAVARELTKRFEEVVRGALPVLAERYQNDGPPRGEVVVVVGPPLAPVPADGDDIDRRLGQAMAEGASLKDASAQVAAETGRPRRAVYARALALYRGGASHE